MHVSLTYHFQKQNGMSVVAVALSSTSSITRLAIVTGGPWLSHRSVGTPILGGQVGGTKAEHQQLYHFLHAQGGVFSKGVILLQSVSTGH